MGQAHQRLTRFKEFHPLCCYCGGARPTESIDHAPPRSMFFLDDFRPKGLEVPACKACHGRFSPFDDLVSVLTQIQAAAFYDDEMLVPRRRWPSIQKRFPNTFAALAGKGEDIWIQRQGLIKPAVKVAIGGDETRFAVTYFTARMVAALYYERCGEPLPLGAYTSCSWTTNFHLQQGQIPHDVVELASDIGWLRQGKRNSIGQFEHRSRIENGLGVFVFALHRAMVLFGFLYGVLEEGESKKDSFDYVTTASGIEPVNRGWPINVRY